MSRYEEDAYREFARCVLESNEMSFDPVFLVATGGGPGAWVQGWFWVSDESMRKFKLAMLEGQTTPPTDEV